MTKEELELLKETVDAIEEGRLTRKEKILLVLGIQSGLYSNDKRVKEQISRLADICLSIEAEYQVADTKDFDN